MRVNRHSRHRLGGKLAIERIVDGHLNLAREIQDRRIVNVRIGDFGRTNPVVQQRDRQRELNAELRGNGIARSIVREARDFPERVDLDGFDLVDSQIGAGASTPSTPSTDGCAQRHTAYGLKYVLRIADSPRLPNPATSAEVSQRAE